MFFRDSDTPLTLQQQRFGKKERKSNKIHIYYKIKAILSLVRRGRKILNDQKQNM